MQRIGSTIVIVIAAVWSLMIVAPEGAAAAAGAGMGAGTGGTSQRLVLDGSEWSLLQPYRYEEARRFERGWNRGVDAAPRGGVARAPVSGRVAYAGQLFGRGVVTIETTIGSAPAVVTLTGLDQLAVRVGQIVNEASAIGRGSSVHVGAYDPARRTRYLPVEVAKARVVVAGGAGSGDRSTISGAMVDRLEQAIRGEAVPEASSAGRVAPGAVAAATAALAAPVPSRTAGSAREPVRARAGVNADVGGGANARAASARGPRRNAASGGTVAVAALHGAVRGTRGNGAHARSAPAPLASVVLAAATAAAVPSPGSRRGSIDARDRIREDLAGGSAGRAPSVGALDEATVAVPRVPLAGLQASAAHVASVGEVSIEADDVRVRRALSGDDANGVSLLARWVPSLLAMVVALVVAAFVRRRERRAGVREEAPAAIVRELPAPVVPDVVVAVRGLGRLPVIEAPVRDAAWSAVESGTAREHEATTPRRGSPREPEHVRA